MASNGLDNNDDYISILTNSGFFSRTDAHRFSEKFEEVSILSVNESSHCTVMKVKQYGKWYIIKRLKPEYAKEPFYIQLFEKEFDIGYHLDHPHIARVISKEYDDNGMFIISEYVDGTTLRERMDKPSFKQNTTLIRKIVLQINQALSYIHSKQIIHRDLKPENILITHNGNNVKIIDFGLSDTDYHHLFKGAAGTRKYAAPEQLEENPSSTHKSDYYSLGIILLEILTNKTTPDELKPIKQPFKEIISGCTIQDIDKRFDHEQVNTILNGENKPIPLLKIIAIAFVVMGLLFLIQQFDIFNSPKDNVDVQTSWSKDSNAPIASDKNKSDTSQELASPSPGSPLSSSVLEPELTDAPSPKESPRDPNPFPSIDRDELMTTSYNIGYRWIDSLLSRVPDFDKVDNPPDILTWYNTYILNGPYDWSNLLKKYSIEKNNALAKETQQSFLDGGKKAHTLYFEKLLNSKNYYLAMGSAQFYQLDMNEKLHRLTTYYDMVLKGAIILQEEGHTKFTEHTVISNKYFDKYIRRFGE